MKKTVAVVFGGRSAEHEVSIITAHIPIIQSLQASGLFNLCPIYIGKDGSWYSNPKFNDLTFFQKAGWQDELKDEKKINLLFDNGLKIVWPGLRSKTLNIDIVFPAMHGTYGEDGSLMGLLRMAGVPFVGCDLAASAVTMDKVLTKQILQSENIDIVPYVWFTKNEWSSNRHSVMEQIGKIKFPLFVKPAHLGSSIAISKVKDASGLENAIEVAMHYDDKVLIEESIENLIELTLPIMGNDIPQPAELEQPLNKSDFFDFSDKYLSQPGKGTGVNSTYSQIPADIKPELTASVKQLGIRTYKILGCSGIARIDFLMDSISEKVYVNEVNPLPGSLYHHNWRKAGVSAVDLVTKLISFAEERFKEQNSLTTVFSSDILSKVGGGKISNV